MNKFIEGIKQKSEPEKRRWAFGLSLFSTFLIFVGFAFYNGYLTAGLPGGPAAAKQKAAAVESLPSPIESSKDALGGLLSKMSKEYKDLTKSLSDVFVPFVTGIEVYERK